MNERIKQLEKQCWQSTETEPYALFDVKKFADMIVRECYEHCKGQLLNSTLANEHNLSYNDGVADCAIGLLQHFGVEE